MKKDEAYDKAKKCLDQLLSNDQIPFYGYVEIMLQLDVMKREGTFIQVFMKDLTEEEKQHFFDVWTNATLKVIEEKPQGKRRLIDADDFKKRLDNMEYVYLQACYEDLIDAIECEVTYFNQKDGGDNDE